MGAKIYQPVWREQFRVRSSDIGLNFVMRMSSVCGYFQEIAGRHANHLDVGYHFMQQSGKVWVLSRLFVNVLKYPQWGQEFYAETWPLGAERIFFRRDHRIGVGDETYINAASYWILLDLSSRRPSSVAIDETVLKTNAGKFAMELPSDGFPVVTSAPCEIHRVKYSDLDQNRHVNNARYVEWIFDLLDQELLEHNIPTHFAIEYKHEVRSGDSVALHIEKTNDKPLTYAVEGSLQDAKKVCLKAKIVF